ATIGCGSSPFAPITQISSPWLLVNAVRDPSGEADAPPAPSRSRSGVPPRMEMDQMLDTLSFASAPLASNVVPSGNQESLDILEPAKVDRTRVFPVPISRKLMPVSSA